MRSDAGKKRKPYNIDKSKYKKPNNVAQHEQFTLEELTSLKDGTADYKTAQKIENFIQYVARILRTSFAHRHVEEVDVTLESIESVIKVGLFERVLPVCLETWNPERNNAWAYLKQGMWNYFTNWLKTSSETAVKRKEMGLGIIGETSTTEPIDVDKFETLTAEDVSDILWVRSGAYRSVQALINGAR